MDNISNNPQPSVMSRAAFASYVQQQLQALAGIRAQQHSDNELTLRIRRAPVRIALDTFYADYCQQPAQLDTVVAGLLQSVYDFKPARLVTDFARLRQHIYPMLKPVELLVEVRERNLPMLTYSLFLSDLIITYVIDQEGSLTYINEQHMQHWQIEPGDLHTQALANLRQRTTPATCTVVGEREQRLLVVNSTDGYAATRLLLPDVLSAWCDSLPGRVVIGIPNRDFLIALSDVNRHALTNVARQIQFDREHHTAGLTDQLFTLVNGEVREYIWE